MPPRPLRTVVFSCLLALCASGRHASAQPAVLGTAEVAVGGGHDTNVFLQVTPDAANRQPHVGGWFGRAAPSLGAAIAGGGWRLEAAYGLDYRHAETAGQLVYHDVELGLAFPRLWFLQPRLAVTAGRFDSDTYFDDRFTFFGAEAGLRLHLGEALRVIAAYRFELREFPERGAVGGEKDRVHLGELRLAYRPSPTVEIGVSSSFIRVVPTRAMVMQDGAFRLLRLGPELEVVWRQLTLFGGGWGAMLDVPGYQRDYQAGAGGGAILHITKNVDAAATFEWTASVSRDGLLADRFSRRYAAVNLVAHATAKTTVGRPELPELRPVVRASRVRFRLRAPEADAVQVVGSWDAWAASGGRLARTREDGLWELWIEVPPGTYQYRFLVDGRAVKPPDAARYVPDDFGGQDAVLEVREGPRK